MPKRKDLPAAAIEGLPVVDPRKFARECTRALKSALENNRIRPTTLAAPPRRARVSFVADPAVTAREIKEGEAFPVIPLGGRTIADAWLPQWLAVELNFAKPALDNYLTSVGLSVLSGHVSEEVKRLWFRAEWDTRGSARMHAQPHWHFHEHGLGIRVVDTGPRADFGTYLTPDTPSFLSYLGGASPSAQAEEIVHVHYAMASEWHRGGQSGVVSYDTAAICKWLGGCIRYIRGQVEALASRA